MTGAIYARYSPGVQREKSSTIEAQVAMCRQKAQAENVVIVEEHIYQDHNVSGGSMEREGFQRMMANIHAGDFPDILYVKDDKRLFRNVKEALSATEEIWNHDVKIRYCLSDVGDPRESDDNWFMQTQYQVFAEMERRRKAKETHAHQKQNALSGYVNGGLPPFGFHAKQIQIEGADGNLKPKLVWEIDPETAPAVEYVFQRFSEGKGGKIIAEELNQMGFVTRKGNSFSKVSICEWLRHPFPFAGCLVWNRRDKNRKLNPPEEWVKVENAYQGIITQTEAEEVFRRSQVNKGRKLSREGKYLMTGLLKCPECGYRFVSHSDLKRNQFFYICGTRSRRTSGCGNKLWIQMKRFETQLFQKMEETILSDGFLEDYIQRCQTDSPQEKAGRQKQHESVAKELHQVEQRMENLITALADASLPTLEVSRRYKKEEAKKKELEARLSRQKTVATDFKVDLEEFRHLMRLELLREETRKAALHALIEEIVAYPDAVIEVKYRIRNRYRTVAKAVEAKHDLRVCTATAVHTLRRIIFQRKRSASKTA